MSKDHRLPVFKIIIGAILIGFERRDMLWREVGMQFVALTLLTYVVFAVANQIEMVLVERDSSILIYFGLYTLSYVPYLCLFTFVAVPCHRMILLGSLSTNIRNRWQWTMRETRFAVSLVTLFIASYYGITILNLILALPMSVVLNFLPDDQTKSSFISYLPFASIAIVSYISSRVSILFPSIAIENPLRIDSIWRMSRGNGLRLTIIAALFFYLESAVRNLISGDNPIFLLISISLGNIIAVLGVIALSLSYSEINKYSLGSSIGP